MLHFNYKYFFHLEPEINNIKLQKLIFTEVEVSPNPERVSMDKNI